MRRILIVLLLLFPIVMHAQSRRLVLRNFDVDLVDLRAKTDPVYDNNDKPTALVDISIVSIDSLLVEDIVGVPEHSPGNWVVHMSEYSKQIVIRVEGFEPFVFVFPPNKPLISGNVYTLDLAVEVINPIRTIVMPTFSYNLSQYSYGIMLGFGNRNVGFIHAKTDFHFGLNPDISCDAKGNIEGVKGWFTGKTQKSRFAITAGYMRQVFDPLYIFAGGGYGSRILTWEMFQTEEKYNYARVEPFSFRGYEVELGLLFRFGPVCLSAGVQTNQFKYFEANVGIGVML